MERVFVDREPMGGGLCVCASCARKKREREGEKERKRESRGPSFTVDLSHTIFSMKSTLLLPPPSLYTVWGSSLTPPQPSCLTAQSEEEEEDGN